MNQELEQYLQFFINYKQKNWSEWLVIIKFAVNNKIYSVTKVSLFIANYRRELRIRVEIRRKDKVEETMKFVERIRKVQKKAKVVLRKAQKEMK